MKAIKSTEKGQVLVLLVLGIVALLGFTAFAIDGGMVYSDRRHAQNGADAASLTGGGAASNYIESIYPQPTPNAIIDNWDCSSSLLVQAQVAARNAAVSQALANGYTIDQDINDLNGVSTDCGEEDNGGWSQRYIDVITYVTRDTPTSFAHFVFGGPLTNSVEAVTRLEPPHDLAYGNAIFALREDCPNVNTGGVKFIGTSGTTVINGGIFSNACMRGTGDSDVTVIGGEIACVGETDDEFCYKDAGADVDPYPEDLTQENRIKREDFGFDPAIMDPICASLPSYGNWSGAGVIRQGRYGRIRVNAAGDILFMQPGLYCVSGDITMNGGALIGHGVTIYLTGGGFTTNGGITVKLSAPPVFPVASDYMTITYGSDDEPIGMAFSDWMINALGYDPATTPNPADLDLSELYPASSLLFPPVGGTSVGGSKAVPGLLIYSRDGNTNPVNLLGNSDSYYIGTVFAPDSTITAGGTSALEVIRGQLIAGTVQVGGTAGLNVTWDGDVTMVVSTELELHE